MSQALEDAIKRASDKGIIFVAAAGNSSSDNDTHPHYPSNYDVANVVSVAAHNSSDVLASFSCYGRNTVHVAAPGEGILSTVKGNTYKVYSGTSMATPHVSGALGLLVAKEGRMSHAAMRERLLATSVPVVSYRGKVLANGRLNVYNLLTNTRPVRNEPNPNDWETVALDGAFETEHPYLANIDTSRTVKVNGAKFIRAVVKRYDLERGYDYLNVSNSSGQVVETVSGVGEDYHSYYADGDTLKLEFHSDRSINKWGFIIEEVQVIFK